MVLCKESQTTETNLQLTYLFSHQEECNKVHYRLSVSLMHLISEAYLVWFWLALHPCVSRMRSRKWWQSAWKGCRPGGDSSQTGAWGGTWPSGRKSFLQQTRQYCISYNAYVTIVPSTVSNEIDPRYIESCLWRSFKKTIRQSAIVVSVQKTFGQHANHILLNVSKHAITSPGIL